MIMVEEMILESCSKSSVASNMTGLLGGSKPTAILNKYPYHKSFHATQSDTLPNFPPATPNATCNSIGMSSKPPKAVKLGLIFTNAATKAEYEPIGNVLQQQ